MAIMVIVISVVVICFVTFFFAFENWCNMGKYWYSEKPLLTNTYRYKVVTKTRETNIMLSVEVVEM